MIRLVDNRDIDRALWDRLILAKGNARMYLLSAYLDAVCWDWQALVFGDYDVLMPLPIRRHWTGRLRHDIPLYVQQLGIIGLNDLNQDLKNKFILTANNQFNKFIHSFNQENGDIEIDGLVSEHRTNYELDLNNKYESIRSKYGDNLKRNLRKVDVKGLQFRSNSEFELLESFVRKYSNSNDPSPKHIKTIRRINQIKDLPFRPDIYAVWMNDKPIAVAFAPRFQNRITLLIPRSNDDGREVNAMAYLIDQIIQKNSESEMVLDFEGSMLSGVGQFYRRFGAVDRPYVILRK